MKNLLGQSIRQFMEGLPCKATSGWEIVTDVVNSLAHYREEGVRLFPVVFLSDKISTNLTALHGTNAIFFGSGPVIGETARRGLKQCARLGEGRQWALYLTIDGEVLSYGVFRGETAPLTPTPFERLRNLKTPGTWVVGLTQLAEDIIELRANSGAARFIHLSGATVEVEGPTRALENFLSAVSIDTPPELRNHFRAFYYRLIVEILQGAHGTLVAVVPKTKEDSALFFDGVRFSPPIDITPHIQSYEQHRCEPEVLALQAHATLLRGLMAMDGITVLRSDGCIVGYNYFIHGREINQPHAGVWGGARRRAYEVLCSHVGKELIAAFYRSQDGAADCRFSIIGEGIRFS
jgi:hypothetical protein